MKPQRGKYETLNALAAVEDLSFNSVQPVEALAAVEGCSFSSVQPVYVNTYEFRRDGLLHLPVRDGGKLLPVSYPKMLLRNA